MDGRREDYSWEFGPGMEEMLTGQRKLDSKYPHGEEQIPPRTACDVFQIRPSRQQEGETNADCATT
jgi:hypothetical protein